MLTSIRRGLAASLLVVFAASILGFAMTDQAVENRDFMEYWAVGQRLIRHGNPYDSAAILQIFRDAGDPVDRHMILRNPPFALFITLPLGFLGMRNAAILWSLATVAALMFSIRMLWLMQGARADRVHLIGYCFAPVLACLLAGQLGILLLLGATVFVYFHNSKPYFAGAALLLCLLKPHLFLPFSFVLIAWAVTTKPYRIVLGAGAAWIASTMIAMSLDPAVWSQYLRGERGENIQNLFIPCLSLMLRVTVHRSWIWLQFIPVIVGSIWALWYFSTRRGCWKWVEHGPLLLLVSVMVAPYAWFTDEVLVLPAMLLGLYRVANAGRSLLPFGCLAGIALMEVIMGVPLTSPYYLWTVPAWLGFYLYSARTFDVTRLGSRNVHGRVTDHKETVLDYQ